MAHTQKTIPTSLPLSFSKQIRQFISILKDYNSRFPKERQRNLVDYDFLQDFFPRVLADQNKRADEVASSRYRKAVALSMSQFPRPLYWDLCIDGRVLTILMYGLSAPDFSLRVPAGMLRDFVRNEEGKLILMDNSSFAKMVDRALTHEDEIVEIFDSHINCLSRRTDEITKGYDESPDDWLVSDVLYKKEMSEALREFVKKKYKGKKHVITIQTSFNPQTGYAYMGLETSKALSTVMKDGTLPQPIDGEKGYTEDELDALSTKGIIFSTKEFARDDVVSKIFARHAFDLDWKTEYVESTEQLWKALDQMKGKLLPEIVKKLSKMYPHLPEKSAEMKTRAMLLLANAFSGYLHTHHVKKVALRHDADEQYAYGVLEEEGIRISEGGYPPFDISMFGLYSGYAKNLPARIEHASSLVRQNRRRDVYSIPDRSRVYKLRDDFVKAPVPIVVSEIVNEDVDEHSWDLLQKIDWSDMSPLWNIQSDVEFLEYLEEKGITNGVLLLSLNALRSTMAVLYSPERRTSNYIVEQHIVALPVMSDKYRRNRAIIPFFKLGFV